MTVGILTISDRAAQGIYEDESGPALRRECERRGWAVVQQHTVPDERVDIQKSLRLFAEAGCDVILTTGGTGISPRDVTPEAIREIMRLEVPGFGETMRAASLAVTANGILSRSLAAVVGSSFVVALPGKPAGAVESLIAVAEALAHATRLAARKPTTC